MQNGEESSAPSQERHTAPWGVQLGAVIACAMVFGYFEGEVTQWPTWAYYPPELLLAICARFVVSLTFENPSQYSGPWRALYWRVLCYESLLWSWNMVFFLSALDAGKHKNGLLWLIIMGIFGFSTVALSKKLISRFRCPHCHQFFFKGKNIKDGDGVYPFSLSKWPNTLCQYCSWPLGREV